MTNTDRLFRKRVFLNVKDMNVVIFKGVRGQFFLETLIMKLAPEESPAFSPLGLLPSDWSLKAWKKLTSDDI